MNTHKIKLLISQRILTRYREDAFYELSKEPDLDLCVAFGDRNSKKFPRFSSIKKTPRFNHKRLKTISLIFERFNNINQFFFSPGILFTLIRFRPDVVLTEGTSNIVNNLLTCSFCLLFNIPYVWWDLGTIRGQQSENKFRRMLNPIIDFFINKASGILGYSTFAKEYFISLGIEEDKITVAGNTIRLTNHIQYRKENENKLQPLVDEYKLSDKFVFITVGAVEKQKQFNRLVEVFLELDEQFENLALIIVGDGDELSNLKMLAEGKTNIHFPGSKFEDVGSYFMLGDVFVLPGLGGLSINEAMVYGLPVISAAADGTEVDLVIDSETGFLLEGKTNEELYQKMKWCVEHKIEVDKMGELAYKHVTEKYTLENMIKNITASVSNAYNARKES